MSVFSEMTSAVDAVVARGFFEVAVFALALPAGFVLIDDDDAKVGVGPFLLVVAVVVGACFFGDELLFVIVGVDRDCQCQVFAVFCE